jgi:hypothetical protein
VAVVLDEIDHSVVAVAELELLGPEEYIDGTVGDADRHGSARGVGDAVNCRGGNDRTRANELGDVAVDGICV